MITICSRQTIIVKKISIKSFKSYHYNTRMRIQLFPSESWIRNTNYFHLHNPKIKITLFLKYTTPTKSVRTSRQKQYTR